MVKKTSLFIEKFRRITSGGKYLPEIDGLRFVSIFWVVIWMHSTNLINKRLFNNILYPSKSYYASVVTEGGFGVAFFFIISGFILVLPFIREKLYGGKKVSLSAYYLRRVARLELPYLAALLISFCLLVVVLEKYSFSKLLPHLGVSSVYLHNIIYGNNSPILSLAWSLEIEVHFYLLLPLLAMIFGIRHDVFRRVLLFSLILTGNLIAYYHLWQAPVLLHHFICYFLSGMLLADLYCKPVSVFPDSKWLGVAGLLIFAGLPFLVSVNHPALFLLKNILMITVFYLTLFNSYLKRWFSIRIISVIGGMCYSIYLVHFMVLSGVSKWLSVYTLPPTALSFVLYLIIMAVAVLVISAVFYRFIEQPCMRKNWWKSFRIR